MEITANTAQTVTVNNDVLFTNTTICGCPSIVHRTGSGLVTLRGLTKQCRARFRVYFSGNAYIPEGGTAPAAIQFAIAINGETLPISTMISTPAAAQQANGITTTTFIDVPAGCCSQIAIKNISSQSIIIQNANLIIERVA